MQSKSFNEIRVTGFLNTNSAVAADLETKFGFRKRHNLTFLISKFIN